MSESAKFYFKPAQSEQIETAVHIESDRRSAILGTVLDERERPIENAMALLYRADRQEGCPEFLCCMFTDSDGAFTFGPLEHDVLYLIKIFRGSVKIRELEIRAE